MQKTAKSNSPNDHVFYNGVILKNKVNDTVKTDEKCLETVCE